MSFEMPEQEKISPRAAVFSMQKRHQQQLEESGLTRLAFFNTARDTEATLDDIMSVQDGRPVVLGVENEDSTTVFLAFQTEGVNANSEPVVRTKMIIIGSRTNGEVVANHAKGYTPSHFEVVEKLYEEAKELQQTVAPNYNIEQGIVSE